MSALYVQSCCKLLQVKGGRSGLARYVVQGLKSTTGAVYHVAASTHARIAGWVETTAARTAVKLNC